MPLPEPKIIVDPESISGGGASQPRPFAASHAAWQPAPALVDFAFDGGTTGYDSVQTPANYIDTLNRMYALYDLGVEMAVGGFRVVKNNGGVTLYKSVDGVTWTAAKTFVATNLTVDFTGPLGTFRYWQLLVNSSKSPPVAFRLSGFWLRDAAGNLLAAGAQSAPSAPAAPGLAVASASRIDVTTSALPSDATSLTVQRSTDNSTWANIAVGLGGNMAFQDIGRTAETTYFYRQLAVNSGGSTPGPSISAMTFPLAPDAPLAPSLTVVSATEIDVAQPALPARASSLSLQRSPDNATWTTIATGLQPG